MQPLVTPSEVRNTWCFGLPLTKEDGRPMPDEDLELFIESATKDVERRLGVFLRPTKIVCNAEAQHLVQGVEYDLEEPPYDYNLRQYRNWGFLQLRQYPIISVERVRLVLPNGLEVVDFPMEWVKVYKKVGQINIVPYAGSPTVMTVAGATGSAYPLLTGQFSQNFPQAIWVDYTAGLGEWKWGFDEEGNPVKEWVVPPDIRAVIGKIASIDVLGIAGDAILAGYASISTSIDGMHESFSTTASATNATYGARILQLRGEVNGFFGEAGAAKGEHGTTAGGARSYYKGFTMKVL